MKYLFFYFILFLPFKIFSQNSIMTTNFDCFLRVEPNVLSDVIVKIPAGKSVSVIDKLEEYFKVSFGDHSGYVSQGCLSITASISNNIQSKSDEVVSSYSPDGYLIKKIEKNGVSVAVNLSVSKVFNKYYMAYIQIENNSGKSISINPENIRVSFLRKGVQSSGELVSRAEFIRKVDRNLVWNSVLYGFNQSAMATNAAKSVSTTTSTTYVDGNASSSITLNSIEGPTSGRVNTISNGTSTTVTTTKSYDAAVAYVAREKAKENIETYNSKQDEFRDDLYESYLIRQTISDGQKIIGFINIKFKNADQIKLNVPIRGERFEFTFNK